MLVSNLYLKSYRGFVLCFAFLPLMRTFLGETAGGTDWELNQFSRPSHVPYLREPSQDYQSYFVDLQPMDISVGPAWYRPFPPPAFSPSWTQLQLERPQLVVPGLQISHLSISFLFFFFFLYIQCTKNLKQSLSQHLNIGCSHRIFLLKNQILARHRGSCP